MDFTITTISEDDNAGVAKMIRTIFEQFNAPKEGTVYVDPTTDALYEVFKKEKSIFFVAKLGDEIVGTCGIYPTLGLPNNCVELVKFYISEKVRGKGLGRILMQKCYDAAREFGYTQMYIESLPVFAKAVGIYEKQGFKSLDHALGDSGHSGCSIWMLKDLS